MASQDPLLRFDLTISKATENEDLLEVVRCMRPWPKEKILVEKLSGGCLNTMYCCWLQDDETENTSANKRTERLVVRIFLDPSSFEMPKELKEKDNPFLKEHSGNKDDVDEMPETRSVLDHTQEIRNLTKIKGTGIGPELLAIFKNGLCYRFIYGDTLDCQSVRSKNLLPYVTEILARVHTLPLEKIGHAWSLEDLKFSVQMYPPKFQDPNRIKKLLEIFPDKDSILKEMEFLKQLLKDVQSPMVFCHNDSKGENFIWDEKEKRLTLIDFEHSFNNTQAAEIGSHFIAYNDIGNSKPGQYPDRDFQLHWIRMYLEHWYNATGRNVNDITDIDVENLYVNANKQAQMSRLLIGIGCLFMASEGIFDSFEFCLQLLKDYVAFKDEVHALKLSTKKDM